MGFTALTGLGTEGLGAILAVITVIHWRKSGSPKSVSIMALLTGILLFAPIGALLAGLGGVVLLGAPLLLLLAVGAGQLTWHEGLKGRRPHYVRTPVTALLTGSFLGPVFGGVVSLLMQTLVSGAVQMVSHVGSSWGG